MLPKLFGFFALILFALPLDAVDTYQVAHLQIREQRSTPELRAQLHIPPHLKVMLVIDGQQRIYLGREDGLPVVVDARFQRYAGHLKGLQGDVAKLKAIFALAGIDFAAAQRVDVMHLPPG
ncbi:MAG: hypothetical protein OXT67_11825 [Zetaproteobacteria bacterium]|nr:hypothetical protein [Zetaproteobacteria bacterium]